MFDLIEAERARWPLWLPVAAGTGIGLYFVLPSEPNPAIAGLTLLAAAALTLRLLVKRHPGLPALVGALAMVAGFTVAQWRTQTVAAPILGAEIGPLTVTGSVEAIEFRPTGFRIVLDGLDTDRDLHLERVRLVVRGGGEGLMPGHRISVRAVLMPPPPPAAPGAHDFGRILYFKRIGAVGYTVSRPEVIADQTEQWRGGLSRLRLAIANRILDQLDGATGAVAAALLTGMRGRIPEHLMEAMRASGLAHLLAISGLHIGLFATTIFFAVRLGLAASPWLALRFPIKKWAALAALLGALFYMVITGATVPTQRAFVMVGLVLFAVLIDRTAISMRLVAWAALVILAVRPESLLGASFQLSFAAVVALVAAYERLGAGWMRWQKRGTLWGQPVWYLAGVSVTSIVAIIATAPFAAFHFNRIAVFGLAANLIAVPATALWVMPWGLVALLLMPLGLEAWPLAAMGWGIDVILAVATTISQWPGALLPVRAQPTATLALIALGGLWLCLWSRPWRLAGLGLIGAGLIVAGAATPPDILVNRDGRLFAVRDGDDQLALSTTRRAKFAGEMWLRRAGQGASPPWPEPDNPWPDRRLTCDRLGCIYRPPGYTVALIQDPRAITEDCAAADVVISADPVGRACAGPDLVIDRFDLWRDGAHAVWLYPSPRARSVRAARGDRPWVVGPE